MTAGEMRALADASRFAVERILDGFPAPDSPLRHVTRGRDVIGFLKLTPSRLRDVDPAAVRLVRGRGDPTVYAVLDGARVAFASERQFTGAGFEMRRVQEVSDEELAGLPQAPPLSPHE
jgi:hypothetical protein